MDLFCKFIRLNTPPSPCYSVFCLKSFSQLKKSGFSVCLRDQKMATFRREEVRIFITIPIPPLVLNHNDFKELSICIVQIEKYSLSLSSLSMPFPIISWLTMATYRIWINFYLLGFRDLLRWYLFGSETPPSNTTQAILLVCLLQLNHIPPPHLLNLTLKSWLP